MEDRGKHSRFRREQILEKDHHQQVRTGYLLTYGETIFASAIPWLSNWWHLFYKRKFPLFGFFTGEAWQLRVAWIKREIPACMSPSKLQADWLHENQVGLALRKNEVVQSTGKRKPHYRLAAINWICAWIDHRKRQGSIWEGILFMQPNCQPMTGFSKPVISTRIRLMPAHLEWNRSLQAMQVFALQQDSRAALQIPKFAQVPTINSLKYRGQICLLLKEMPFRSTH